MECERMNDVNRNRVNRNRKGGSPSHKAPRRWRGGKLERSVAGTVTSLPRVPPPSAWLRIVFATRPASLTVNIALGATRVVLAWVFIYYGAGKLFGAFHGPGIRRDFALLLEHRASPSRRVLRSSRWANRVRRQRSRWASASSPASPDWQSSATW